MTALITPEGGRERGDLEDDLDGAKFWIHNLFRKYANALRALKELREELVKIRSDHDKRMRDFVMGRHDRLGGGSHEAFMAQLDKMQRQLKSAKLAPGWRTRVLKHGTDSKNWETAELTWLCKTLSQLRVETKDNKTQLRGIVEEKVTQLLRRLELLLLAGDGDFLKPWTTASRVLARSADAFEQILRRIPDPKKAVQALLALARQDKKERTKKTSSEAADAAESAVELPAPLELEKMTDQLVRA
jgi:hypothetical protein